MTKRFVERYLFPLIILLISIYISFINFVPGTYLLGWDNLPWEFNIKANILRSLSVSWQEYQGLGLLGGMAHAADLPRQLILLFISFFFPISALRYLWTFAMLVLGPLGVYFLLGKILKGSKESKIKLGGLTGSIFYIFNLATLQNFFTPYEAFVSFYGFLPWLIYFIIGYLNDPKRKRLIYFAIVSLLATPAFYIQTLFVVYIILLTILIVGYFIKNRNKTINSLIKLILTIICVNSFWLIPVAYFSLTNSSVVVNSKINQIATSETRFMNQGTGNLRDISQLKGFWFNYQDLKNSKFEYLMSDWRNHLEEFNSQHVGNVLFAISIAGFILTLFNSRNSRDRTLIVWGGLGFLVSYIMLTAGNPPFGFIHKLLSNIPLFSQAFRSPFTKWSVPMALFYSMGIGLFVYFLTSIKKIGGVIGILGVFVIIGLAILMAKPVFQGKLISDNMRLGIPGEYFELFEFFKTQPKQARIARFPVQTFWGWDFNSWGYRGSGFLWYGIQQPILDRAFDVWSEADETYYHQISTALYAEDFDAFQKTLEKYDVSYVLIDESVYAPDQDQNILRFTETKNYLDRMGADLVFEKGFLEVYGLDNIDDSFVYPLEEYFELDTKSAYSRRDDFYVDYGDYISREDTVNSNAITLNREKVENVKAESVNDISRISFDSLSVSDNLFIPAIEAGEEIYLPLKIILDNNNLSILFSLPYEINGESEVLYKLEETINGNSGDLLITIGGEKFEITDGVNVQGVVKFKVGEEIVVNIYDHNVSKVIDVGSFETDDFTVCYKKDTFSTAYEVQKVDDGIKLKVSDYVSCAPYNLGNFNIDELITISLPFKSHLGSRPHFCVLKDQDQVNCQNEEVFYKTKPSENWTSVERIVSTQDGNYWISIAARPSDGLDTWEIEYKKPVIRRYQPIKIIDINRGIWDKLIQNRNIKISDISKALTLSLYSKENKAVFSGGSAFTNCDFKKRGELSMTDSNSRTYKSDNNGSLCDFAYLSGMSTKKDYLLRFTGEQIQGNGLKFYLTNNISKRADLEGTLPEGNFDELYSILDWDNLAEGSYSLNFQNRSFAGEEVENILHGTTFYQIPANWLSKIIIGNEPQEVQDKLKIESEKKFGTYRYDVNVSGKGVVVLSQGYDRGWVAFDKGKRKILEHVKVNGWANGWIVVDNQRITIIYWPQYLQFIGFGLLGFGYLFILKMKKNRHIVDNGGKGN